MNGSNVVSIFTSNSILLSGSRNPIPATIEVDVHTGKIIAIHDGRADRTDEKYKDIPDELWNDTGETWILPGLVE